MSLRLLFEYATGDFDAYATRMQNKIAMAATGAISDAADIAKATGRESIAAGGFSKKWQNALRSKLYPPSGTSSKPAAFIYHKIPYAGIFETGGRISSHKNYLWLPTDDAPRVGGRPISAQQYVEVVGPLISVNVPGHPPMLFGPTARVTNKRELGRFGKKKLIGKVRKQDIVPLYYGKASVTESQRFDVVAAIKAAGDKIPELFLKHLEDSDGQ